MALFSVMAKQPYGAQLLVAFLSKLTVFGVFAATALRFAGTSVSDFKPRSVFEQPRQAQAVVALCIAVALYILRTSLPSWMPWRRSRYAARSASQQLSRGSAAQKTLQSMLNDGSEEYRQELFAYMATDAVFEPQQEAAGLDVQRDLAMRRLHKLSQSGLLQVGFLDSAPLKFFQFHEAVGTMDGSTGTKLTVQYNLFGGTLLRLGTERHHAAYLKHVDSLDTMGCFALTERGYGNNTVEMRTEARLDRATDEWIVHSPEPASHKYWITNGAKHATLGIVFAQMYIDETCHGVHAFVVPLREPSTMACLPGVHIRDMGLKLGCNGVDNAEMWFDHVRVPRTALLDRYSQVSKDGAFTSAIPKLRQRFLKVADQLLSGRLCLSAESLGGAKLSLASAVHYSAQRLCFGPTGKSDFPILRYGSQARSLLPRVATAYALCFGLDYAKRCYAARPSAEEGADLCNGPRLSHGEVVTIVCALKSYTTWLCVDIGHECRERCGGAGYLASSQISRLICDGHAAITAEGDNIVLAQKLARDVVLRVARKGAVTALGTIAGAKASALGRAASNVLFGSAATPVETLGGQLDIFRTRESQLLSKLMLVLFNKRGAAAFKAWNANMDLALALARAYTERIVMEAFHATVRRAQRNGDAVAAQVLQRLASLWALHRMEQGMRWFLMTGALTAAHAAPVAAEMDRLCRELVQEAVPLVDAFGLPPHILHSPIADPEDYMSASVAAAERVET